ncbi:claudin-3-like [Brachionichthys hirsutus]|uniref:claudin-3-like n=1 Tax=Brachionichthys hirsutus TaxID=412623 RepID=UPI003604E520
MRHLTHTAHLQFLGLVAGILAWILIVAAAGLDDWRLWQVSDVPLIPSGVVWVGIWRVCFNSPILPKFETCHGISISDRFAPAEIGVAQVLMMLAVISGLAANVGAASAVRMAYFSVEDRKHMRLNFLLAGILYMLTAILCLIPLLWNVSSVLRNSTIDFPPEFQLSAPEGQRVGLAIGVGIAASIMMLISGMLFLCYHYARKSLSSEPTRDPGDPLPGAWTESSELSTERGRNNPAFHSEGAP